MNVMMALIGLAVLGAVIMTVLDIVHDGRGSRMPPRSHPEEVGS